jgi:XTP/dITP diphosphohydrolase
MGGGATDDQKNAWLLEMLNDVPNEKRTARYVCAAVLFFFDGQMVAAEGSVEGLIAREPRGENGFGYDPIFFIPEYGRTAAEITDFEKDRVSHRGAAFRALLGKII